MDMYRIKEVVSHIVIEGKTYVTYGIHIQNDEGCATATDISTNRRAVATLRRRMHKGRLSPLHLQDVVEDWLNEGLL